MSEFEYTVDCGELDPKLCAPAAIKELTLTINGETCVWVRKDAANGSAIDRAIKELPPDYEISVTLANDAWIVDLEVPDCTQETLGSTRHIATKEDCPLDHAINEAVVIAKLLEEREP